MTEKLILPTRVTYGDVDRTETMLLPRIFKLLQEVAILHANVFGTGTEAIATRGETWVLARIAAEIGRYPRHDESLRVETWSSGVRGFKGYRDFRVYDAREALVLSASSLWLYISTRTKSIVRVPRELAATFPVCTEGVARPDLEQLPFDLPGPAAAARPLTLRYSDFDVNEHVNNAAYFDFVQTALAQAGSAVRPRRVQLKYSKAIPATLDRIDVRTEVVGGVTRFSFEGEGTVFAHGEASE